MRPGMITHAIKYAKEAHGDQVRKYTGEPYYKHGLAVARIVQEHAAVYTQPMLVAALLHDVVEDTDITLDEIQREFGSEVADLVGWLTDVSKPEDGNRTTRKAIDRAHSAQAPIEAKSIKLADLIDNTNDIVAHDEKFAKVYMAEKRLLLEVLGDADSTLFETATSQVKAYYI